MLILIPMLIYLKLELWDEAIIWIFNNYVMIKGSFLRCHFHGLLILKIIKKQEKYTWDIWTLKEHTCRGKLERLP